MITIEMLILVAIVAAVICIIASFILKYKYIYKTPVLPPKPVPVVDFEKDVVFLHYLISHKLEMQKTFNMLPKSLSSNAITRDVDVDKIKEFIVQDVYLSLSKSYKATLSKYFSDDALIIYITEQVMKQLTVVSVEQNYETLKKISTINKINALKKENKGRK